MLPDRRQTPVQSGASVPSTTTSHDRDEDNARVPPARAEPSLRRPEWVAHVLDDDDRAVLLHLPTARRLALSPEATAVWALILDSGTGGTTSARIAAALAPRYAAEPSVIADDVRRLLQALLDADLLEPVAAPGAGASSAGPNP